MASADVATAKTKAATAIDLIIGFSRSSSPTKHALSRSRYTSHLAKGRKRRLALTPGMKRKPFGATSTSAQPRSATASASACKPERECFRARGAFLSSTHSTRGWPPLGRPDAAYALNTPNMKAAKLDMLLPRSQLSPAKVFPKKAPLQTAFGLPQRRRRWRSAVHRPGQAPERHASHADGPH